MKGKLTFVDVITPVAVFPFQSFCIVCFKVKVKVRSRLLNVSSILYFKVIWIYEMQIIIESRSFSDRTLFSYGQLEKKDCVKSPFLFSRRPWTNLLHKRVMVTICMHWNTNFLLKYWFTNWTNTLSINNLTS